jgi:cytochrome oxidase Cu insertion factor (SCO1/SenC/PrrC family)
MRPLFLAGAPLLLALLSLAGTGGCTSDDDLEASLLPVGGAVPDITVTDMSDQSVAFTSLKGQTLLVNFWFYH